MVRFINSSNRGTVKAVSPWLGLQIMPFTINWLRAGAELGHRAKIFLFRRCQPVEAHAENAGIYAEFMMVYNIFINCLIFL